MLIRTHLGLSVDGFIATPDGLPAFLAMPDFLPTRCRLAGVQRAIDADVMGRVALDAGLESWNRPWPGKQIYVLTSRPVPPEVPADVVVACNSPSELLDRLRGRRSCRRRVPPRRTAHAQRLPRPRRGRPARAPGAPGHPRQGRALLAAARPAVATAARAPERLPRCTLHTVYTFA
jgi:hypothetical protein